MAKGRDWEYEKECRGVSLPSIADETRKDDAGRDLYLFEFPPDCLTEVIFGYRMDLEIRRGVRDCANIRGSTRHEGTPHQDFEI